MQKAIFVKKTPVRVLLEGFEYPLRVLAGSGVVPIVGEDNLGAFLRQSRRDRCANSAGCACDQCNFVLEFKIYSSPER